MKKTGHEIVDSMFDEITETRVKMVDGKPRVQTVSDTDFAKACKKFIAAHRTFEYLDNNPDKYTDRAIRLAWWNALEEVYETGNVVWRGFVGEHPDPASNRQYAQFRELLLAGKPTQANA
jgi:hypothetical protein